MLVIIVVALIAHAISGRVIERLVRRAVRHNTISKEAEEKRENTLISVLHGVVSLLIWIVAGLTLLSELGVAIGPMLAALGIMGVAVGFGGQYLIRDLISGLFILLENQYRIGDIVCFDSTCGSVEAISLRMTTLRDLDGTVHHVPHGQITRVSNETKIFSRVNLDIGIGYGASIDQAIEIVNRVGLELAEDPEWRPRIRSAPAFRRVEELADSSVVIKIVGDVAPLEKWSVTGELRKRLKEAFDAAGIEIPFPQMVVHQGK